MRAGGLVRGGGQVRADGQVTVRWPGDQVRGGVLVSLGAHPLPDGLNPPKGSPRHSTCT